MGRLLVNLRRESGKLLRRLCAPVGAGALPPPFPEDFPPFTRRLWRRVSPYTMTSRERVACLEQAVRYLVAQRIDGDVVECGVAAGGSMMAAAWTLIELGDVRRRLLLYDTFAGMTEPTAADVSHLGKPAMRRYRERLKDGVSTWINHPIAEVRTNLARTGYPADRIELVEGPVEETLPARAHPPIALLRLDTDWYESTRAEMEHLYPALVPGGILILDDYNRWMGSRKAVDEYFAAHAVRMFLVRIDDHAVVGVKGA